MELSTNAMTSIYSYFGIYYLLWFIIALTSCVFYVKRSQYRSWLDCCPNRIARFVFALQLVLLTGFPPSPLFNSKITLIAHIMQTGGLVGVVVIMVSLTISWLVYYQALRNLAQANQCGHMKLKNKLNFSCRGLSLLVFLISITIFLFFLADEMNIWLNLILNA